MLVDTIGNDAESNQYRKQNFSTVKGREAPNTAPEARPALPSVARGMAAGRGFGQTLAWVAEGAQDRIFKFARVCALLMTAKSRRELQQRLTHPLPTAPQGAGASLFSA